MIYENVEDMSKDLGVTRQTVYNRIKKGRVVMVSGFGGQNYYVQIKALLKVLISGL